MAGGGAGRDGWMGQEEPDAVAASPSVEPEHSRRPRRHPARPRPRTRKHGLSRLPMLRRVGGRARRGGAGRPVDGEGRVRMLQRSADGNLEAEIACRYAEVARRSRGGHTAVASGGSLEAKLRACGHACCCAGGHACGYAGGYAATRMLLRMLLRR